VTVFHILDPYELEFPFTGTWRFRGLEGEADVITQPERVRDLYLRDFQRFLDTVRSGCERSRVDYVLVSTARPLDVVISEYLIRRMRTAKEGSTGA
jgi:hypothetical protein